MRSKAVTVWDLGDHGRRGIYFAYGKIISDWKMGMVKRTINSSPLLALRDRILPRPLDHWDQLLDLHARARPISCLSWECWIQGGALSVGISPTHSLTPCSCSFLWWSRDRPVRLASKQKESASPSCWLAPVVMSDSLDTSFPSLWGWEP